MSMTRPRALTTAVFTVLSIATLAAIAIGPPPSYALETSSVLPGTSVGEAPAFCSESYGNVLADPAMVETGVVLHHCGEEEESCPAKCCSISGCCNREIEECCDILCIHYCTTEECDDCEGAN